MSNMAPTTTANKAPWAWYNLAGAAFCRLGVGLAEVGPVAAGSASTKLVVVTTTTPPLSIVEVKVDVTGFSEDVGVKVGFPVTDVPDNWSVHSYHV
jgi:S-formylglutathione hydrolase FrmB